MRVRERAAVDGMNLNDPEWELIDPNPDIHALYSSYNDLFFDGKLSGIEVLALVPASAYFAAHWSRSNGVPE